MFLTFYFFHYFSADQSVKKEVGAIPPSNWWFAGDKQEDQAGTGSSEPDVEESSTDGKDDGKSKASSEIVPPENRV